MTGAIRMNDLWTEPTGDTANPNLLLEPAVIERAGRGEAAAFNLLVSAYRRRIFGIVSKLIGCPEDVEDVAQEVFLRVHRYLGQLRNPAVFEPWLHRIIANATCDYLRRKMRSREIRLADMCEEKARSVMQTALAGDGGEEERQVRATVKSLLSRISPEDRVLLLLKEVQGFSLGELEQIYGVDSGVLKGRLFRARQRTLKALEAHH